MRTLAGAIALLLCLQLSQAWSWNASGHRLIAQIAYDNLTPHARARFDAYNHALDKVYEPLSFVNSAVWLDAIRSQGIDWYDKYHYINLFFTTEDIPLPSTTEPNGVWATKQATRILENPKLNDFDKGISLRILLHVVGDLHQPLHAASRVSSLYPNGDKGGTVVILGKNPVAMTLHGYWDAGGGVCKNNHYSVAKIAQKAAEIERRYPCKRTKSEFNAWAEESYALAINIAYRINPGEIPSEKYQRITRKISEQRISMAGCRLAVLMNRIDQHLTRTS
jgi:hypothetical protein